jgi:hypothetical protein
MVGAYPIYPVKFDPTAQRQVGGTETMGTKQKWWLVNRVNGRLVLLKLARPNTGEDWSEKVAFELAKHLHIPCPRVELAQWEQRWGVLCWDFLVRHHSRNPGTSAQNLIHGNELLLSRDPTYPVKERYRVSGHTISAVYDVLRHVEHVGHDNILDDKRGDGFDMFVGYLMLDALIGNTDRHHENWGVITRRGQPRVLAPTYDHASSLGRELSDARRQGRLGNSGQGTVESYALKTTAAFWSEAEDKRLTAREALLTAGRVRPKALVAWQRRLAALPTETIQDIVDRVPEVRLTSVGKLFALELLRYNLQAILELVP